MKCQEARERMVFHVDGEDDAVGPHVDECASCRAYRDAVAREKEALGHAIAQEARATAATRKPLRHAAASERIPVWPFVAAAAALLIVALLMTSHNDVKPPVEKTVTKKKEEPKETPPPREKIPEKKETPKPKDDPIKIPPKEERKPEKKRPEETKPEEKKPDETKPEEKKPEEKQPTEVAQVTLTLDSGTPKNLKWKGARTFKAGESIQAQTALRIAWSERATLYLKEGSTITVKEKSAFSLDAGAVLLETCGTEFSVQVEGGTIKDLGTRFSIALEKGRVEAIVYEGRISCGDAVAEPGEKLTFSGGAAPAVDKAPNAYPAWMAKIAPRYGTVLGFTFQKTEKYPLRGTIKDGALHAFVVEEQLSCGVETDATTPFFTVPARGEFWITYFTTSDRPLTLRCRAVKQTSVAFDYIIQKPVVGKPVAVRVPLSLFASLDKQTLAEKDRVHILYVHQPDVKAKLWIDDLSIVERKE